MMEIPSGKYCEFPYCPFCQLTESVPMCSNRDIGVQDIYNDLRSPACLAAYPNGAVVKIEPKP